MWRSGLQYLEAVDVQGCFVFDAAQNCGQCFSGCTGSRGGSLNGCTIVGALRVRLSLPLVPAVPVLV